MRSMNVRILLMYAKENLKQQTMSRAINTISTKQCVDLFVHGYIIVDGVKLYRISKHTFLQDAMKEKQEGDQLWQNHLKTFILSPTPRIYEDRTNFRIPR